MLIQIVNQSILVTDADISGWLPDLQSQLDNEFQAAWNTRADLQYFPVGNPINDPTQPVCTISDNSDVPGALGYHDKDANDIPFIRVFAADCQQAGVPVSSVLSHEICELLADPLTDATVVVDNGDGSGIVYFTEDCDPVESDSYLGPSGTALSNFVFPQWFDPASAGPWDQIGTTPGPLQLAPGGYQIYRIVLFVGDWQQQFGATSARKSIQDRDLGNLSTKPAPKLARPPKEI